MKYILLFLALGIAANAQTTKIIGGTDLQDYWPMEEGTGTTTADRGPSAVNGTLSGSSWITGILGNCVNFNGTSTSVSCGTAFRPAVTQPWSVSCWVYDTAVNGALHYIFCNLDAAGTSGISIVVHSSNKLGCAFNTTPGAREGLQTGTITANVWHFVVGTWDGSANVTSYVDTVAATNTTVTGSPVAIVYTGTTGIGEYITGAAGFFSGKIDDVKTYNHALTQKEVSYLYYAGRQGTSNW